MNIYEKIFKALNKEGIKYLVVGGVAVNLHGYNRFTGDIDILMALEKNNLEKMERAMASMGYVSRIPVELRELGNKTKLANFIKQKGLKAYTFISNDQPQLNMDIIIEGSLRFRKFDDKKIIIKIWNLRLPVISINDLIEMKKQAGRSKDMLDLEALLKLKYL